MMILPGGGERHSDEPVGHLPRGASTAVGLNVTYRLGKLGSLGLLKGRWLDCGCADGGYSSQLADLGAESVVGVDVEEPRIERARARIQHPSVEFAVASADTLPFPDRSFDGILLNEVLEHVDNEERVLKELYRVLRPGGALVVISPNRWFPFEGHGIQVGSRQLRYPLPLIPWLPSFLTERFLRARNYWPHELRDLVARQGYRVETAGFVFPVFEVYRWLPRRVIRRYWEVLPRIERIPFVRRFGVSNMIVARRPS